MTRAHFELAKPLPHNWPLWTTLVLDAARRRAPKADTITLYWQGRAVAGWVRTPSG